MRSGLLGGFAEYLRLMPRRIALGGMGAAILIPLTGMAAGEIDLIGKEDGPKAFVVVDDLESPAGKTAQQFVEIVEEATGVRLEVKTEGPGPDAVDQIPIYIGQLAPQHEGSFADAPLLAEEYVIVVSPEAVSLVGKDTEVAQGSFRTRPGAPTRWAANRFLEDTIGVRWLWPGKLGTYVPKKEGISISPRTDRMRPQLEFRRLRTSLDEWRIAEEQSDGVKQAKPESSAWLLNHGSGLRVVIPSSHAFQHWWDEYSKDHPDFFAETPKGFSQPYPRAERVKLRLANPAVIEQIAEEYQDAGAPDIYNVSPNDGSGFDVSAETRAWDVPPDQPIMKIWRSEANLSARYVRFWNRLYDRLKEINSDVRLASFAYSCFREPPPESVPLTAKMNFGFVGSYQDYDEWKGWSSYGARLYLRPNWWHVGANAPFLPLHQTGDFLSFALENGMYGMDFDAIIGYWSTQGLNYYQAARFFLRPELTTDDIIDEYCSAFGSASSVIREYLTFWMQKSEEIGYPCHVGGGQVMDPDGLYNQLVEEGKVQLNPIGGSAAVMPYAYSEADFERANSLLNDAQALLGPEESAARDRIAFLRDGLNEFQMTWQVVSNAIQNDGSRDQEIIEAWDDLFTFRRSLTPRHVVWGEHIINYEGRYRKPYSPSPKEKPTENMEGM